MPKQTLKLGDIIKVIKYRPGNYAPGVKDELGTEDLFKSMVGKRYRIRGFDQGVYVELWPKPGHKVWIEPDLIELTARKTRRNITMRSGRRRTRTSPSGKHSARRG